MPEMRLRTSNTFIRAKPPSTAIIKRPRRRRGVDARWSRALWDCVQDDRCKVLKQILSRCCPCTLSTRTGRAKLPESRKVRIRVIWGLPNTPIIIRRVARIG